LRQHSDDYPALKLRVEVPKRDYRLGEPVRFVMRLINNSDEEVRLAFPTSQIFDFLIESTDGRISYSWSSDKMFLQVITERELGPEEAIIQEFDWKPPTAGKYRLKGFTVNFRIDGEAIHLEAEPVIFKVYR